MTVREREVRGGGACITMEGKEMLAARNGVAGEGERMIKVKEKSTVKPVVSAIDHRVSSCIRKERER